METNLLRHVRWTHANEARYLSLKDARKYHEYEHSGAPGTIRNHDPEDLSYEAGEAIIMVGSWSSSCSACDDGCDPYEERHETVLRYSSGRPLPPGCGAKYVAITSMYFGDGAIEATKRMRPDLPYTNDLNVQ